MRRPEPYADKLARLAPRTLLSTLPPETRAFVERLALRYRFTFQELREVAQAARDLEMWREASLPAWWAQQLDPAPSSDDLRREKQSLLSRLAAHLAQLAAAPNVYPPTPLAGPTLSPLRIVEDTRPGVPAGRCPTHATHTLCCGLHTIDAVAGCSMGCSYCAVQTFGDGTVAVERDLAAKLAALPLDPQRFYHLGTGQASDALAWGNRGHILDALCAFATTHPNVLLELKTKSDNVRYFLEHAAPPNVVPSWSLSTEALAAHEEHRTASVARRLDAARSLCDRGRRVGFHFHPMLEHEGWVAGYRAVAQELVTRFHPDEVLFVSMGSLTMTRSVVQQIRRRGGESKILEQPLVPDALGKWTYPEDLKAALFGTLHDALSAWHGQVPFYLCMEEAPVWTRVFGDSPPSAEAFFSDMYASIQRKLGLPALPPGSFTAAIAPGASATRRNPPPSEVGSSPGSTLLK
ncbi:MAG: DNA photolyase [Deltaproteobacteria bacterium]|nr:DNA photolyase [Deltaproteobacteria bacterium]